MSFTAGTVIDSSESLIALADQIAETEESGSAPPLNAVVLAEIAPRFSRIEMLGAALPSMCLIEEIPLAASFLAGTLTRSTVEQAAPAKRSCLTS